MKRVVPSFAVLALGLVLACGGGGGGGGTVTQPPPTNTWASSLTYTDPPGTGFRLLKNSGSSTPSRLVLELVGPSGQSGQGVTFILNAEASKVSWTNPPGAGTLVKNLAFNLGNVTPALVGKDKGGGTLQGAAFQKSGSQPLGQPLVQVCLEFIGNNVPVNSTINLAFTSGNTLSDSGTIASSQIAVGKLVAQ